MNEPQEPRSLREVLDELERTLNELERTLNSLEKSTNSLFWKTKLLLLLAIAGFTILVIVVLGQR